MQEKKLCKNRGYRIEEKVEGRREVVSVGAHNMMPEQV